MSICKILTLVYYMRDFHHISTVSSLFSIKKINNRPLLIILRHVEKTCYTFENQRLGDPRKRVLAFATNSKNKNKNMCIHYVFLLI